MTTAMNTESKKEKVDGSVEVPTKTDKQVLLDAIKGLEDLKKMIPPAEQEILDEINRGLAWKETIDLTPPEPQGDIVNDPVAARKFNEDVRRYVRARLQEEWKKRPRSLWTCAKLSWALFQNWRASRYLLAADQLRRQP